MITAVALCLVDIGKWGGEGDDPALASRRSGRGANNDVNDYMITLHPRAFTWFFGFFLRCMSISVDSVAHPGGRHAGSEDKLDSIMSRKQVFGS